MPLIRPRLKFVFDALKGFRTPEDRGGRLVEIPIEGTIELGVAAFVERMVGMVEKDDVVVVRIKTFGGRVDGAVGSAMHFLAVQHRWSSSSIAERSARGR